MSIQKKWLNCVALWLNLSQGRGSDENLERKKRKKEREPLRGAGAIWAAPLTAAPVVSVKKRERQQNDGKDAVLTLN